MSLALEKKKERLHAKADLFLAQINGGKPESRIFIYDFIDTLLDEVEELRDEKAGKSELHELIVEVRNGFALMETRFAAMDKRFEDMQSNMDKRFAAMDKRFEDMQKYMDKRFEAVDKRFEAVDKRFEDNQKAMDKRFEAVDKRFEEVNARIAMLQWVMLSGFTVLGLAMTFFRFFHKG